MLRLRPSELTLTPDDVDETFRRVALRQTSGAREHWTVQPRQHPSRPILRRGPQRAVRDAITVLGNIPILQPQQAVLVSVNDDDHVSDQEVAQSAVHDISSAASNSSPHDRDDESIAPPVFPVSSESGTVQLPFRPRPDSLELSAPITEDEQAEDASHTPRNQSSEPTRPTPTRIVDTEPAQSPSVDSIERAPGLRGGGHSTNTHHDITQDATRAPLPMHQIQTLSSPAQQTPLGDPTKSPSSSTDQPTLYLKGYFAQTPRRARYRFRERLPHTEPRRSSSRQAAVARSLSSGAAPAGVTRPSKSPDNPSDDVFGTHSIPESSHGSRRDSYNVFDPGHCAANVSNLPSISGSKQQADQSGARPRQSSSEATSASAVYSWYGSLPSETRFPSSEHSAHHETSSHAPPSDSSTYSSNVVGSSPHGLSPLPSMPYTRIHEPASSSAPGYVGGVSEGYVEAATAAAHDLQSPLDPYAEHYQRQLQAQHALPYFRAHGNPTVSSVGGAQMRPPSHGQNIRPDNPSVFRQAPQRSSEYPTYSATYGSHVFARTEQRSSENAPVVGSFHHGDVPRHGRVQTQRAAYERMQNPGRTTYTTTRGVEMAPSRHSAPQSISPYDMSNRPRDYTSHHTGRTGLEQYHRSSTPFPLHQPRQASQSQPQDVPHTESPNPSANRSLPPSTDTPRYAAPPRVYRTTRGAFGLHPTRDSPVTGVAFAQGSGTTSRRSDSPFLRPSTTSTTSSTTVSTTARTRRRVPPAQRDQENDDEAGVMRREEGNVRARYGEDAQRAMWMNETPPRVGRVERRMV